MVGDPWKLNLHTSAVCVCSADCLGQLLNQLCAHISLGTSELLHNTFISIEAQAAS